MSYRIGNLRALANALIVQAESEGNEAEHYLGIEIINLARREGLTEDQIIDAISVPRAAHATYDAEGNMTSYRNRAGGQTACFIPAGQR